MPAIDTIALAGNFAPVGARGIAHRLLREPSIVFGAAILLIIVFIAIAAPWLGTMDPAAINPSIRNQLPGFEEIARDGEGHESSIVHRMGTDTLGRDVYSRTLYGARASMIVGGAVVILSVAIGLAIGLAAAGIRGMDGILMRVMDGLMAIPPMLLAIALMSLTSAGLFAVIVAIVIPEVPRVARLVRSVALSVREEPYVEAARAIGVAPLTLLLRHILPNTMPTLIVQASYVFASAILVEAILSFLGVGIPPETPTWGNIMAQGRALFRVFPHNILYPGIFLALTVLAVNMLGDGLRDVLDPRATTRR